MRRQIGEQIGIDWAPARFDVEQFRRGMNVELEHGLGNILTNAPSEEIVRSDAEELGLHDVEGLYEDVTPDGIRDRSARGVGASEPGSCF
jgi:hypothetical protein